MADNHQFETPEGVAVYPRLKTPDTKFDDLGIYKADTSVPKEAAKDLMATLSAIFKAHTGKAPKASENTMWYVETDDAGEETGNVVFKIRVKNKLRKRDGKLWDRRPALFDAALKPIDVNPYGGTRYIVSGEVYCWDAGGKKGVSLQPLGVQVLELVEGSGGTSAAALGFKSRDGYTAEVEAAIEDEDEPTQADEVDDDEIVEEEDGDY